MKKIILALILSWCFQQAFSQARQENFQLILKDDWKMQSAVSDAGSADKISKENYDTQSWYKVSVPTTIIAGLLANKVYDFDPFMGRNLKKLSDTKLDKPWWFRREFTLPAAENGKNVILRLHGINYKANIWLNGVKIADSTQTKGPFRIIQLDVTKHINYTGNNVLALQITRPFTPNKSKGDLAIDYADWIPYPAISAWLSLVYKGKLKAGDTVLILGATGITGKLAVQIARHLGAGKIIAIGRNQQALDKLGADVSISLNQSDDDIKQAIKAETAKTPFDVVVDYLWGKPAELLLNTLAGHNLNATVDHITRYVQVGEMAGSAINLPAAILRSTAIELTGAGGGSISKEVIVKIQTEILPEVFKLAAEGKLSIDTLAIPLKDVADAWQQEAQGKRVVITM